MLYLNILVISLSGLLSAAAAIALDTRGGLNDVGLIVDLIQDLYLYPICAWYLGEPQFPHTTTSYVGTRTSTVEVQVTVTDTATDTSTSGTLDVTDTTTDTTTTTYTAASVTTTDEITDIPSTMTITTTIISTTTIFPGPTGINFKRDIQPELHRYQVRGIFPPEIDGSPSGVLSEACSSALATRTLIFYAVSTTDVTTTSTVTASATDTLFTPATTSTDIITDTNTDIVPVTETVTSSQIFTTVPTTTETVITTVSVCPAQTGVSAGGIPSGGTGTLNFDPTLNNELECCQECFTTNGCGLWFFFSGFGCFTGVDQTGPDPDTQCPTGDGTYQVIPGPNDGDIGGPGPCFGGAVT